jgi:hypothetical protein
VKGAAASADGAAAAQGLLMRGRLGAARAACARARREAAALSEAGKICDAHRSLAGALLAAGDRVGAEHALCRARWGAWRRKGDWDFYYVGSLEVAAGDLCAAEQSLPLTKHDSYVRSRLVRAWLRVGNAARALRLAAGAKTPRQRVSCYLAIAGQQLELGDRPAARATLRMAVKEAADPSKVSRYYRDGLRSSLASALLEAGLAAEARAQFELIGSRSSRRSCSQALARIHARAGESAAARGYLQLAGGLAARESDYTRYCNRLESARTLHAIGDRRAARRELAEAVKALAELDTSGYYSPPEIDLAGVQALLGDARRARRTALAIADLRKRYDALIAIARGQAEIGETRDCLRTLIYAEKQRTGRTPGSAPAHAVRAVVSGLTRHRKPGIARTLAAGIAEDRLRAQALCVVVNAQLAAGKIEAAVGLAREMPAAGVAVHAARRAIVTRALADGKLGQAVKVCAAIADPGFRDWTLSDIARHQARRGDLAGARRSSALISDPRMAALSWSLIAEEQLSAGGREAAAAGLKAARLAAGKIRDVPERSAALARVARALRAAGDGQAAEKVLAAASKAAGQLPEGAGRVWARRAVAGTGLPPGAAGPDGAGRDKKLLALRRKEFDAWVSRIKQYLKAEVFQDPQGRLRGIKAKSRNAEDAVSSILGDVRGLCDQLDKLQAMEQAWVTRRGTAAGGDAGE